MHHHQVFMQSKAENVTEDMTEPLTDYLQPLIVEKLLEEK